MSSLKELTEKKNSISSINKITKAMQLVSTSKSQKAFKKMKEYEIFYNEFINIVNYVADNKNNLEKYFGTYWVIFASDLGLAGGYSYNIIKTLKSNFKKNDKLLIIGKKAISLKRSEDSFFNLSEIIYDTESSKIFSLIKEHHEEKNMLVKIINTEYISQLEMKPKISNLLPIEKNNEIKDINIEFEPSKKEILKEIIDIYIQIKIMWAHKEAILSEETSRRIAMENASKNGEDIIKELKIEFNRKRQSQITQEISEIIGGSEAMN